ncbi:MAG: DUF2130 domain-containing protein [Bacteroidetes bacterium]|nr:DUF2130 domain-containing protein [Bacteroidota bacterium]
MSNHQIKCPKCAHSFHVEEVLSSDIEARVRSRYAEEYNKERVALEQAKKDFEEKRQRENELFEEKRQKENELFKKKLDEKLAEEKAKQLKELQKKVEEETTQKMTFIENESKEKDKKLKNLQEKEIEFLREKNKLQNDFDGLKTQLEKNFLEKQQEVISLAKKQEKEQSELQIKELQKQLDDQKKLTEEMKRKQDQGSMQLQGEVQELALEAALKESFPFDEIAEVGKGIRGADCIQTVRTNFGKPCGKIIYESKRTQAFSNDWIEKLKADMRAQNADIAVIVTQTMPKDMPQFGEKNGIWVCTYHEVKALASVLRNSILKVAQITQAQENKGDKMQLLYDYLTGNEFNEQWKAIREGFLIMKQSIDTERQAMGKLWKAREKQLEKILLSTSHISGSVEGIAGTIDLKLLNDNTHES